LESSANLPEFTGDNSLEKGESMDHNFSILFLIFAAAILLYAAVLAITKNYHMLPYRAEVSVRPKDPKRYTFQLAKVVALVGLAIGAGAAVSWWKAAAGIVIMIAGTIVSLWLGTKIVKN
jgi:hypothetical protein